MIKYTLKIIDIIDEVEGTKTYYFEKPESLKWEEGSHAHIAHVGFDVGIHPKEDWVRHMSIMTLPEENRLGITTRINGSGSEFKNKLRGLKIGDEAAFFKFGSRMGLRRINKPVILLSMGVGIATMRPLILSFTNDNSNIPHMINMNIDSSGNFVYKDELDKLESENYNNNWMKSRKEFYEKLQQLAEAEDAIYYIVGSKPFIEDCIQKLRENKVENMDIIIDKKGEALERLLGIKG